VKVVVGFSIFASERSNKDSWTKRCSNRAIFLNRLRVGKKSISHAVDVCRGAPGMNALCAANLMRRRTVAAICADEHGCTNFMTEILQQPREQNDCAGHIMRELA